VKERNGEFEKKLEDFKIEEFLESKENGRRSGE
jgi:hypothetical protein